MNEQSPPITQGPPKNEGQENPGIIAFNTLRKLLGTLGISLPFILILGTLISCEYTSIEPSISHYYHTEMRDVFVAILSSFGLFLFAYKGYETAKFNWKGSSLTLKHLDNWICDIAGASALTVAFCATTEKGGTENLESVIHFTAAAIFFVLLAFISIFLFTQSKIEAGKRPMEKVWRNRLYRTCGIVIIACLIGLFVYFQFPYFHCKENNTFVFWVETLALVAFGISWIVKGEAVPLLIDKKREGVEDSQ